MRSDATAIKLLFVSCVRLMLDPFPNDRMHVAQFCMCDSVLSTHRANRPTLSNGEDFPEIRNWRWG